VNPPNGVRQDGTNSVNRAALVAVREVALLRLNWI
jgi:hypothetical protein